MVHQTKKWWVTLGASLGMATIWLYLLSSQIGTPHVTYLKWLPPFRTAFMSVSGHNISYKWIPISKISSNLQRAVIVAEDDQFFGHQGFDMGAIKKAIEINMKRGKFSRGGSTITQQLARNLYLSPRKSLWRKFREFLIAFKLERELPKERILELYLNVVEFGDGIYGAEAASRHYFNKSAANLTRYESAFLAAILPRPRFYDKHRLGPYLQRRIAIIESSI